MSVAAGVYHQLVLAKNAYVKGTVRTDDDGSVTLSLNAGETRALRFPFSLPRSSAGGAAGSTLDNVNVVYRVASGTLSSVTPTLVRRTHTDGANPTDTSVPLTAGTFELTVNDPVTNVNRIVSSVTTPATDNQAVTVSVNYVAVVTFVADTATELEVHAVDLQYDLA